MLQVCSQLQQGLSKPRHGAADDDQQLAGAKKPKAGGASTTWVLSHILDLLRQYPGGLTEPVIRTELLRRRLGKQARVEYEAPPANGASGAEQGAANGSQQQLSQLQAVRLPGRVPLASLVAVQQQQAQGIAPAAPLVVAAEVATIKCLAPPTGSGPPAETAGGCWQLLLADDSMSAMQPIFLHSKHRLLAMGEQPLLAAGRGVRLGGIPPRRGAAPPPLPPGAGAARALPCMPPATDAVVELPIRDWARGPSTDALPHGTMQAIELDTANLTALHQCAPGGRVLLGCWVKAMVVEVGPVTHTPGQIATRQVRLASMPYGPPCRANLLLLEPVVGLGDLLLPGEPVALHGLLASKLQPALQRPQQPLQPPGPAPSQQGGGGGIFFESMEDLVVVVAVADHGPARGAAAAAVAPPAAGGDAGAPATDAPHSQLARVLRQGGGGPQPVCAAVERVLAYSHGVGAGRRPTMRVLLSDGCIQAEAQLRFSPNSTGPSQVREGHCLLLLGAVASAARQPLPGSQTQQQPHPPHPQQQQQEGASAPMDVCGPAPVAGPSTSSGHASAPHGSGSGTPPMLQWQEWAPGADLQNLTMLPAMLTTPLVAHPVEFAALLQPSVPEPPLSGGGGGGSSSAMDSVAAAAAGSCWPAGQYRGCVAARRRGTELQGGCAPGADAAGGGAAGALQRQHAGQQPRQHAAAPAAYGAGGGGGAWLVDVVCGDSGSSGSWVPPGEPLACCVLVDDAQVATHRVHKVCGRPVTRPVMFDFDDDDDGGGAPGAGAAAGQLVLDTPSKDRGVHGLWSCEFCTMDVAGQQVAWQLRGSLTLRAAAPCPAGPPTPAAAAAASAAAAAPGARPQEAAPPPPAPALTLPADSAALQALLGASAEAFHLLRTAQRHAAIQERVRTGQRYVAGLYPLPPQQVHGQGAAHAGACRWGVSQMLPLDSD